MAIEIDDEASHNKQLILSGKFYDDLLKQNSMVNLGWDVYRWAVRQMQTQPESVKDERRIFGAAIPNPGKLRTTSRPSGAKRWTEPTLS